MLDVSTQIVTALQQIGIPVQYEYFYNGKSIPCITYTEYMNRDTVTGDTFGYSEIGFTITAWSDTVADANAKAKLIDAKMRSLGFKRINSNEVVQGALYRKIIDYKCLAKDFY